MTCKLGGFSRATWRAVSYPCSPLDTQHDHPSHCVPHYQYQHRPAAAQSSPPAILALLPPPPWPALPVVLAKCLRQTETVHSGPSLSTIFSTRSFRLFAGPFPDVNGGGEDVSRALISTTVPCDAVMIVVPGDHPLGLLLIFHVPTSVLISKTLESS